MEEENVQVENSNQQEEEVLETSNEETQEESSNESELEARLAKAEELANNYKVRAEKAERLFKANREQPKAETKVYEGDLTAKDTIALMEAKVSSEDIDDVVEYAKFKKISVSEAIKSNVVKTMLAEKSELRQTAQASNVGGSKRSSGKIPDDVLLAKAQKGEFPDNDADLQRLINIKGGYKQ
jgi:hypothetical protein